MSADWRRFLSGTEIRGREEELTDEFAAKVGYAFALWLARQREKTPDQLVIAVGRDPRRSGERLVRSLIRGLTAADCDVLDCGVCATPVLQRTMETGEGSADGAVMVTGGSRGAEFNGFLLFARTGLPSGADIDEILTTARNVRLPERLVTRSEPTEEYIRHLTQAARSLLEDDALRPLLGLRVVVDASHGAGGFFADALEELGADVSGSRCLNPDGDFPDHLPSASSEEALSALRQAVLDEEADAGVLLDADCTCATLVDEVGEVISGDERIALISALVLEKTPGATIVTDSVTSSGLSSFIYEWGGVHYRFRRGSRNVIEEARRLNAEGIDCPVAIETSGVSAFRENGFRTDGMYLALFALCALYDLKREGRSFRDLIGDLRRPVESVEVRLPLPAEQPDQASRDVIEVVLSHTLDNPAWRLAADSREGVRILFHLDGGVDNAWFQLRLSVHDRTVMVLNAQSDVPGGIRRMLNELCDLMETEECALDLTPIRQAASGENAKA